MSSSRSAVKRNRLRHRLGLDNHHRLAIHRYKPWYQRAGELFVAALLGAGILWSYQIIERYLNPKEAELLQLREKVTALNTEVERLGGLEGTGQNAVLMAQSAQQSLAQQLEKAQAEAAKLKEELGYCEKNAKREMGVRKAPILIPGAGTIPAGSSPN